jgi:hypothetical protein
MREIIGEARGAKDIRFQRERYGLRVDRGGDVASEVVDILVVVSVVDGKA